MKQTQQIAEGTHFSALSTGSFSQLNDYVLPVAPGMEIQGKVFMGQTLQTTGAEISFQSFAPGKRLSQKCTAPQKLDTKLLGCFL